MSAKQLGCAIIGTGTIARVHAAALLDISNAYLVLGSSRNRAQAESFARDFACKATDDLQEVLQHDSAGWRGTRAEDGGALMNQAIHSVDLLLWLCGPATRIYVECATQLHKIEAEDLAAAVVHLECGAKATLMASTNITPGFPATLGIYGEHGSIRFSGAEVVHWSVPGIPAPACVAPASKGVATNVLTSHEFHQMQLHQIVDATFGGQIPPIAGAEGFSAVALVQAAYASAAASAPANVERL